MCCQAGIHSNCLVPSPHASKPNAIDDLQHRTTKCKWKSQVFNATTYWELFVQIREILRSKKQKSKLFAAKRGLKNSFAQFNSAKRQANDTTLEDKTNENTIFCLKPGMTSTKVKFPKEGIKYISATKYEQRNILLAKNYKNIRSTVCVTLSIENAGLTNDRFPPGFQLFIATRCKRCVKSLERRRVFNGFSQSHYFSCVLLSSTFSNHLVPDSLLFGFDGWRTIEAGRWLCLFLDQDLQNAKINYIN